MIAALYVQTGGCYFGIEGVTPWDEPRDARLYDGPWPVVAHPPCARWGRYATGAPMFPGRYKVGDDGGCFAAALASVRQWGGVLEHPEASLAWAAHGLFAPPRSGGWVAADWRGGWTCCVEQGAYGHPARKATWLFAYGADLPSLRWGRALGEFVKIDAGLPAEQRRRVIRNGVCQQLSKRQRAATPIPFRDLLISIAESAVSPSLAGGGGSVARTPAHCGTHP